MTEARKREIADEIIAAFKETGMRPCHGTYREENDDGEPVASCAVGVIAVQEQHQHRGGSAFIEKFGCNHDRTVWVARGFDGLGIDAPIPADPDDKHDWYDIGRMVREAVLP